MGLKYTCRAHATDLEGIAFAVRAPSRAAFVAGVYTILMSLRCGSHGTKPRTKQPCTKGLTPLCVWLGDRCSTEHGHIFELRDQEA